MEDRVHLGGTWSGRDIEAVNKTVSGLTKCSSRTLKCRFRIE
jgi:hypothetical protein